MTWVNELVSEYRSPDGKVDILNVDGVPWHDAPRPSFFHRCRVQSETWVDHVFVTQRCPCGARRQPPHGWESRNSRRRAR